MFITYQVTGKKLVQSDITRTQLQQNTHYFYSIEKNENMKFYKLHTHV